MDIKNATTLEIRDALKRANGITEQLARVRNVLGNLRNEKYLLDVLPETHRLVGLNHVDFTDPAPVRDTILEDVLRPYLIRQFEQAEAALLAQIEKTFTGGTSTDGNQTTH